MDRLNAVLDILKEKPYNLRSLGKDILQAVIDDKKAKRRKIELEHYRLSQYSTTSEYDLNKMNGQMELLIEEIKELQAAMGRIS